jgi:putative Mg2+ transporter-C (MgtC) family protein
MDLALGLYQCMQIVLAFLLGLSLGFEREIQGKFAGIRTYALVAMGACMFALIGLHGYQEGTEKMVLNPSRISSQVVVGIGFIGAGMIFKDRQQARGLTTAATVWIAAAIGLAVAHRLFMLAFLATFLSLLTLWLGHFNRYRKWKKHLHEEKNDNKK